MNGIKVYHQDHGRVIVVIAALTFSFFVLSAIYIVRGVRELLKPCVDCPAIDTANK